MPLYMDVHESLPDGATAADVANAHKADLANQPVLSPVVRGQPLAVVATVELDYQPRGGVVNVRASHKGSISVEELNLDLRPRQATAQQEPPQPGFHRRLSWFGELDQTAKA